jgi:predicted aspartyl protease
MTRYLFIVCLVAVVGEARATVPLEPAQDGHLVVPAYVDGSGPYPFILDTGADTGALYTWFAKKLKLRAGKAVDLSGQTGTTSTPTYPIKSLSIDGHAIRNVAAYGLPNRHDNGKEAGVAGNDLMDGVRVVFDFPCKEVGIHPRSEALDAILPKDAVQVDGGAIADGTVLTLPVQINGVTGVALLDTGSRDSRINPGFAAAIGVDPSSSAFRDADLIYGANSKAAVSRIGPVGTVRFAGISIANAEARVIDSPVFRSAGVGDNVMILGTDLMRDHRLVYDYQAKRFWFGSSKCAR